MKVIIFDETFIPGLGKGPFLEGIEISQDKYFLYKRMGLRIFDVTKKASIFETGVKNRQNRTEKFNNISNEEKKIINNVSNVNLEVEEEKEIIKEPENITIKEKISIVNDTISENDKHYDDVESEEVIQTLTEEDEIVEETKKEENESSVMSEEEIEKHLQSLTKRQIVDFCNENNIPYENTTQLLNLNKENLIKYVMENI